MVVSVNRCTKSGKSSRPDRAKGGKAERKKMGGKQQRNHEKTNKSSSEEEEKQQNQVKIDKNGKFPKLSIKRNKNTIEG